MRFKLLILFVFLSGASFAQDSLQIDTVLKTFVSTGPESVVAETTFSVYKDSTVKKKKKKVRKTNKKNTAGEKIKETVIVENVSNDDSGSFVLILLLVCIAAALACHLLFSKTSEPQITVSKDEDFLSDYLNRILLSRRDYYRNVYLKSEAWKRKRYVVLKRDNWRCVYCNAPATQVHHTRYAKMNIGKEPIEWLVSICKPCHASKHRDDGIFT